MEKLIVIPYTPRHPQGEIHAALETRRFVVLVAHRRMGKTVLAVNHLLKAALTCERERGSFAYVGPFRNQAKTIAWDYLKRYSAPVPGRVVNESELFILLPNGARVRIFGADNPDALRGLYFDGVVLDEVAQMKREVWEEVIRPALSDRKGFAVFIGTPKGINLFSELYDAACGNEAGKDPDWMALRYPATATNAIDAVELESLRAEMGDNAFRQEYLCDFTASSGNALISIDEVKAAMWPRVDAEDMAHWPLVVGVDVARFGEDATVFFPRRGLFAHEPTVLRKLSNTEVAHRLVAFIAERDPAYVFIDQGQGTGVIDLTRELTRGRSTVIVEVPFGSRANRDRKYVNRRAEMWTELRDWLRAGGQLPEDERLLAELAAPAYDYDAAGRIRLEAKDAIKERLNRSTDRADALALTFAVPLEPDKNSLFPSMDHKYGRYAAHAARDWMTGEEKREYDIFA